MVLRPCARPPKQPMVLGGPCTCFKTMYGGDVVMFVPNKIKNIICGPYIILNINNKNIICLP